MFNIRKFDGEFKIRSCKSASVSFVISLRLPMCGSPTQASSFIHSVVCLTTGPKPLPKRRGRRRRKLLDDLKERRGYSHLKEEALDRTIWRARFGRAFGQASY
jgi:hypothetical protein